MREIEEAFNTIVDILKCNIDGEKVKINSLNDKEIQAITNVAKRNKVFEILQEILMNNGIKCLGKNDYSKQYIRDLYKARFLMSMSLLEEFENKGIKYAVLKGAYLGDNAYNEMGIRSSNDLDILIQKESIKEIKKLCYAKGFVPGKSDRENQKIIEYSREQEIAFSLNTHQIATMVKIDNDSKIGFYDTVLDFNFSVSWGGDNNKRIYTANFLKNREKICDSNGMEYYVLKPIHNFIQLCLHAYKEANGVFLVNLNKGLVLRAFLDIYYFLERVIKNEDLEVLEKYIREYHVERYIFFIINIIQAVFGVNKKCQLILERIADSCDKKIMDKFGINSDKTWDEMTVKERFYSHKIESFLDNKLSEEELKQIEMAAIEFY